MAAGKLLTLALLLTVARCFGQLSGSLSPDFRGGSNLNLNGQHAIGNAHENVVGSVGLSANSRGGPATGSLGVDYNRGLNSAGLFGSHTPGQDSTFGAKGNLNLLNGKNDRLDASAFGSRTQLGSHNLDKFGAGLQFNDHSASLTKSNIAGVGSQTRLDGNVNVFKTDSNRFDVNAFKTINKPNAASSYGSHGGGLSWNNVGGHGAVVGFDRTPAQKETNLFAKGNANLWQSSNKRTSLDAFGTVSKPISGGSRGKTDFGAGFGLSHRF